MNSTLNDNVFRGSQLLVVVAVVKLPSSNPVFIIILLFEISKNILNKKGIAFGPFELHEY